MLRLSSRRPPRGKKNDGGARVREGVEQSREAGITTPVLVPLSPDGNQMNGLKAVFAAFER